MTFKERLAAATKAHCIDKKNYEIQSSKLRLALDVAKSGIWEWDIKSQILTWDANMFLIFDCDPDTFKNTYEDFANTVHPEDRDRVTKELEKAIASEKILETEFRVTVKDGSLRYLTGMAALVYDDHGQPWKLIGTNNDVTTAKLAQKRLEFINKELEERVVARTNELSEKVKELEEANKDLSSFSYSVSHDLRAPLRALSGFSDALYENFGETLGESGNRWVTFIKRNAERMNDLIDDILVLSKTTQHPLRKTMVDMKQLVLFLLEENRQAFPNLECDFQVGNLQNVHGDPGLIKQLWQNLISNAMKYSSRNTRVEIQVRSNQENGKIIYSIKDNGVGFDEAYKGKLFMLFQRLHSSSEYEGTGIGLTIAKKIAIKHGGDIWAESKPGQGATFYFSIPIH
ncbi:sensor histidine kinase [Marinoscillum sp.]|uniref:sensor histidine kinase n=1 Tax=Marinoscillum sp. TaxID=2024838 RepID=UPI003BAA91CE